MAWFLTLDPRIAAQLGSDGRADSKQNWDPVFATINLDKSVFCDLDLRTMIDNNYCSGRETP
ncbi:MAG: hypothetical protein Q6K08_04660, partial [Thermostichales cyanobacterium GMQP_bins_62]